MILLLSLSCDVRGLSSLERRLRSGMVGRAVGVVIVIVSADNVNITDRKSWFRTTSRCYELQRQACERTSTDIYTHHPHTYPHAHEWRCCETQRPVPGSLDTRALPSVVESNTAVASPRRV